MTTAISDAGFGIPTSMIILRVAVMGLAFLFCAQGFAFDTVENFSTTLRSGSHYCAGCHDGVIGSAGGRCIPWKSITAWRNLEAAVN